MIAILLVVLLALAFLGIPIAWALGIASICAISYTGIADLSVVAQKTFEGMNSFSMMAIPFFILAGNLMSNGGLTKRLLGVARVMVGWVRGSVSAVCILASCLFGAISGSAIATASAIGGMTIPEMIKEKYDRSYAAAVATAGAICGPIIPPSIGLIVYASITNVPVKNLFISSLTPGVMLGVLFSAYALFVASRRNYIKHPKAKLKEILHVTKESFWAILMPIVVLGCIFGGITTSTEASVIAVAYSLIVGIFVHKDLKLSSLYQIFLDSAVATAAMFILIGVSTAVGWIIAVSNVSVTMTEIILGTGAGKVGVILFVTVLGLILGCLMDPVAAMLIMAPVVLGMVNAVGYSNLEFGIILNTLMMLGHITPPVGASLLINNAKAEANFAETIHEAIPFFVIGLAVTMLLWVFPVLCRFLIY